MPTRFPAAFKDRPQADTGRPRPSPAESVTLSPERVGAFPASPKSAESLTLHGKSLSDSDPDSVPVRLSQGRPGPDRSPAAPNPSPGAKILPPAPRRHVRPMKDSVRRANPQRDRGRPEARQCTEAGGWQRRLALRNLQAPVPGSSSTARPATASAASGSRGQGRQPAGAFAMPVRETAGECAAIAPRPGNAVLPSICRPVAN